MLAVMQRNKFIYFPALREREMGGVSSAGTE